MLQVVSEGVAVAEQAISTAMKLRALLSATTVQQSNLTEAQKAIRGESFTKFEEKTLVRLMEGIVESKYDGFLDAFLPTITTEPTLVVAMKAELKLMLWSTNSTAIRKEFIFQAETGGHFFYCLVVGAIGNGYVDFAIAWHTVSFAFQPDKIETKKTNWFLGLFPYSTNLVVEEKARALTQVAQEQMLDYFRFKALTQFYVEGITPTLPGPVIEESKLEERKKETLQITAGPPQEPGTISTTSNPDPIPIPDTAGRADIQQGGRQDLDPFYRPPIYLPTGSGDKGPLPNPHDTQ